MLLWKPFWQEIINFLVTRMCVFIKWPGVNTIAKILNHILLESAGRQLSNKMCGDCITSLGVEL